MHGHLMIFFTGFIDGGCFAISKANKTEQKYEMLIPFPNMVFGFGMNS
jgi:hypothetical protein